MRDARQDSGLFLALLALLAQLTMAATMPVAAVSLANVAVLCHHGGNSDGPAQPVHQSPDCLLCFFCHTATSPAGLIAAVPPLPQPRSVLIARVMLLPPATAPPPSIVLAARPRGPPVQV